MAGVKGRSGRRPASYERYTLNQILEKSVHLIYCYITDENEPIAKRAELASRFALKKLPDRIETKHQISFDPQLAERLALALERRNQISAKDIETKAIEHKPIKTTDKNKEQGLG